jgi:hypothetical protein
MTRVVNLSNREKLIKGSSILYSIVHATQFLEFLKQLADVSFDGKKGVSRMRCPKRVACD